MHTISIYRLTRAENVNAQCAILLFQAGVTDLVNTVHLAGPGKT